MEDTPLETFNIIQYNTRRSKNQVMATFLRDQRLSRYYIIAIQEP